MTEVSRVTLKYSAVGAREAQRADRKVQEQVRKTGMQAERDASKVDRWTKANRSAIGLSAKAIAGFTAGLFAASPLMRSLMSDMASGVGELVDELLILSGVEGGFEGIADSLFDLSDRVRGINEEVESGDTARGNFIDWLRDIPVVGGPAAGVLALIAGSLESLREGDYIGGAAGLGIAGFIGFLASKGLNKVRTFAGGLAATGGLRWALLRVAGAAGIVNLVFETAFPGHTKRMAEELSLVWNNFADDMTGTVWPTMKDYFAKSKDGVTDAAEWWGARWHRGFENMTSSAGSAFISIGDQASILASGGTGWGRDLGDNFASGLKSAGSTVSNAASGLYDRVATWISHDEPSNDRRAMRWGKHAVQFFSTGIGRQLNKLDRSLASSPLPFGGQPAPPAPVMHTGVGGTTINITVESGAVQMPHTGSGAPDMRQLAGELARIMGNRVGIR